MRWSLLLAAAILLWGAVSSTPTHAQGGITGTLPSGAGFALIVWGGGPVDDLRTAAAGAGCDLSAVFTTADGGFVSHVVGAPPFANAAFIALLGAEVPAGTPLLVLCSGKTPPPAVQEFRIDFIDVGQGDATLITVGGRRLLIDGGRSTVRIQERLQVLGVTDLDAILSTHPDADHIAGLARVLELFDIERVYLNGGESDTLTWQNYVRLVAEEGAEVVTVRRGDTIPLGGLDLDVLHPADLIGESNDDSAVLQLTCGTVTVLLTGDATVASETSMLTAGVLSDVDVLKIGHHGSNTSTGQSFLDVVRPEYGVISAGMNSQFGHPHPEVMDRLRALDVELYHTDTTTGDDTLTMTSNCATVEFQAEPLVAHAIVDAGRV